MPNLGMNCKLDFENMANQRPLILRISVTVALIIAQIEKKFNK
jgi:hypothetical protein